MTKVVHSPRSSGLLLVCAIAVIWLSPSPAKAATESILHDFGSPPKGANPYGGLVRDSVGNFYGTTVNGGSGGAGTVFKRDIGGHQTVLYNFTGGIDGGNPNSGVILDSAGNLYGTTFAGGSTFGYGVVYKVDTSGIETVLYTFRGLDDGGNPYAGVVRDSAGNLYGTTSIGGTSIFYGVIFQLNSLNKYTVLYNFTGGADGRSPYAGLVLDSSGNLYGTALGGLSGYGVVYELDTTGHQTVLYSFTGGADGGEPYSGVIRDSAGNLYGTTRLGGTSGTGTVYKVDTTGHEAALYSFTYGLDGGYPESGVIRDSAGNLYGTTQNAGTSNAGVVYKVDTSGNETALYSFTGGADGGSPFYAGVVRDGAGNLYGTAANGGTANAGVVYKVDTSGHETVLYSFPGAADGGHSEAAMIRDSLGNFYGTTYDGGAAGFGVVYKLNAAGHETILHPFTGGTDGAYPSAPLIRDSAGNIYGTTQSGGPSGAGVIFELAPSGAETVLYSFTFGPDGGNPLYSGVIRDSAGNLYGTTYTGAFAGKGVVYKLDTTGKLTVLYGFKGGTDGGNPYAGVIRDSAGNLYGTASSGGTGSQGVVFKVDTSGTETVLHNFGRADGGFPESGVVRDSAGNLYGTTYSGSGQGSDGVVYKLDTAKHETILHYFSLGVDGGRPIAGVVLDSAGNLYGATYYGGSSYGLVYSLNPTNNETVWYTFQGGPDGGHPQAGVTLDSTGNIYGTTYSGGTKSTGVIFKITP